MMGADEMKSNPIVSCPKCQKLVMMKCLKNHLKTHEESEEYRCGICSTVLKNRNGYIRHKNEIHPKFPRLPHPCQNCGKNFKTKSIMKKHQDLHCPQGMRRRVTCHLCGITVVPLVYNRHIRLCSGHGMKDFLCYFCHTGFSTSASLQVHCRVHSKEKPYSCKHCPFTSAHSHSVWRHELRMHGNGSTQSLYICYFCKKSCNSRYSLSEHINRCHVKEKSYECLKCPRRFSTKNSLTLHVKRAGRTEEDTKQHGVHPSIIYFCYFCKKGYNSSRNLWEHINRYHIKEKGYECRKCPRRFSTRSLFKSHTKTGGRTEEDKKQHGVHPSLRCFCYFCGKGLKTNESLSIHMLKYHVKETSFRCTFHLCSYRTHDQRRLYVLHRVTHENEAN